MRFARSIVVTALGLLVFCLTMTFAPLLPAWAHYAARGGLMVLFGSLWIVARGDGALAKWRPIFFAYFAVVTALTIAFYGSDPLLAALHVSDRTPMGVSLGKFLQMAIIVVIIVCLTKLAGDDLGSLFIRKGRLLLGLGVGLLGMIIFIALTFIPGGPGLKVASTTGGITAIMPAVALFVFSNATMEELLFRGVLLERYELLTGKWLALLSTTLVFALAHVQVTYTTDLPMFLGTVLLLGFLWGLLMQKSNSIWGSILFHAGADVAIILPIYQAMVRA